jgi:hypothetical protein
VWLATCEPLGAEVSRNREIAETFTAQFDPPPPVVQTHRINNVPHRDAWLAAVYDESAGVGITAHVYGGQLHAYIEVLADGDVAVDVGKVMAATMDRLRQDAKKQSSTGAGSEQPLGEPGSGQVA